jgi:hypothetical protein
MAPGMSAPLSCQRYDSGSLPRALTRKNATLPAATDWSCGGAVMMGGKGVPLRFRQVDTVMSVCDGPTATTFDPLPCSE